MTGWHLSELAPFDTETTGINVEADRIVSATVARIKPGEPTDIRSHLIAVDIDIPEGAQAVHGISTEHARANGRPAAEVLDLVAGDLALALRANVPVVGHNLAYDFTILDRDLRRNGLPTLEDRLDGRPIAPVIDTYVLDKQVDRFRPGGRKLVDLCPHYGVRIDGAHDSTFDAMASARIFYRIGQRSQMDPAALREIYAGRRKPQEIVAAFRALGRMSLAELHEAQIGWRREQQAGLADYFRSKGQPFDDVDGQWPMRPFQVQEVPA